MVLAVAALLGSCTQEGDGIFEQVVSQGASSSYRIRQFIGNTTETDSLGAIVDNYYFIEEEGLFKNGANIRPGNYSAGCMDGRTIYLYNGADAKIYQYDVDTGEYGQKIIGGDSNRTFGRITQSGFLVETTKDSSSDVTAVAIWDIERDSQVPGFTTDILSKYSSILSSDDSILVEVYGVKGSVEGNAYYLYDRSSGSFGLVSGISGKLMGAFQKVSDDKYYTIYTRDETKVYSALWTIRRSDGAFSAESTSTAPNYLLRESSQSPSFYDADLDGGTVVFRSASKYETFSSALTDSPVYPVYAEKDSGYVSGIYASDMELMNIRKKDGASDDTFVFAFYKYGLFLVTPSGNSTPIQLKW